MSGEEEKRSVNDERPGVPPTKPVKNMGGLDNLPDLSRLSLEEIEQLIAQKKLERSRNMLRNVRSQAQNTGSVPPLPPSEIPLPPPDLASSQPIVKPPPSFRPEPRPVLVEATTRFRPVGLTSTKAKEAKSDPKEAKKSGRIRDIVGWTLEALVIVAVMAVVGNFILQQFGLSLDLFGGGIKVNTQAISPARAEGPLLEVAASGSIAVPPTPTATPAPTVTPTAAPVISEAKPVTAVPPTPTPIIAPTPAPFVVQPIAEQPKPTQPKFSVPTRIVIPKIGLDASITEVTVNLGTWQVADYAVGHHQGTSNAGDSSNMVLAGHRDVRGSIFLRLDELQIGDEFTVFSNTGQYRYLVNQIVEVEPTEISVMSPTLDSTATLITCTPIGIASKRLIVKARLVN
jgi:LPXTG-site transpeptidase (sortase) family protein